MAELPADPALDPAASPEQLLPASIVFVPPAGPVLQANHSSWWQYISGADWRHPEGPGSSIKGKEKRPVVHIAHADTQADAAWTGKQLPTETEWERAAWGGREGCDYAWGDELHPGGVPVANTFQGDFPHHNSCLDGYARTSPVVSFFANGYGLADMIGNVWEWTDSWCGPHDAEPMGCCVSEASSIDRQRSMERCRARW